MVTPTRILLVLWLAFVAACGFDSKQFGDRTCSSDSDCSRPDESCQANTCTQRACSAATDCGAGFAFDCTAGGCVATSCTTAMDCPLGFSCPSGFCQASFNVASVVATTNTTIEVTFDAAPDQTTATALASYAVSGLTLSGTPTLSGSTVTLATSPQAFQAYTVTVAGVVRATDHAPLTTATATFTGRSAFNVVTAAAATNRTVVVTFDAPPDPTSATSLANYSVLGLTLSGTPSLSGNSVTLQTAAQAVTPYMVTVTGVRRASDAEPLTSATAMFTGRIDFNVMDAAPLDSHTITVTFDSPPDMTQATNMANYAVSGGLTLTSAPTLVGSTVTISTSPQAAQTYTVTVTGVTRGNDAEPLSVNVANFMGRTPFNVMAAAAVTTSSMTVTFDAPPVASEATDPNNYDIAGITLGSMPTLSGNTVTFVTSLQSASTYMVTVSGVHRASDGEALTTDATTFTGREPFDVAGAASITSHSMIVTFDFPPTVAQATNLANYSVSGLTLSGTPSLSGNTVTITTSDQSATSFTVTVSGVTRALDNEPLTVANATFTGRAPFDVQSAASTTNTTFTVTFDAPPSSSQATTLGNYTVNSAGGPLVLTGVTVAGNVATLTTVSQTKTAYSVVVSGVTRALDGEALTVATATFTGRAPFDVESAASTSNITMTVTFDAPPDMTKAMNINNYSVSGLALSGPIMLAGNVVTINTASQAVQSYTVVVTGVTRASDGEALTTNSAGFTGRNGFNVASAASTGRTTMTVTFDAAPNVAAATTLANYSVTGGLTLSAPTLSGNVVTLTTTTQTPGNYTVTVAGGAGGVTRALDGTPLSVNAATFNHAPFDVASAVSLSNTSIAVTFDATPNSAATTIGNYSIPGLALSGVPVLNGNTVTITTAAQAAASYTITVNSTNVMRLSDGEPLVVKTATFTGRPPFNVSSAASTSNSTMTVTFSDPPDQAQAQTLAAYSVSGGLTLTSAPVLAGNTVTLHTSQQAGITYTVTVTGVTRAADAEPLTVKTGTFTGTAATRPTVTTVAVTSTNPNNGATFYNTGTATVTITGTSFTFATAVTLNDVDGAGTAVNTPAAFTIQSDTQITATFPAGIRSAYSGWTVRVANSAGTSTSAVTLVVKAGLLVGEVLLNAGSGTTQHEFVEIYNPTDQSIDTSALGLSLHLRDSSSGGNDTNKPLTYLGTQHTIVSHGFLLIVSQQSVSGEAWYAHRDATYDAGTGVQLDVSGGVYISLSSSAQAKVIDKVGFGAQRSAGREGNAVPDPTAYAQSTQRNPAGTQGHANDSDVNSTDFKTFSTTINPRGTMDAPQP